LYYSNKTRIVVEVVPVISVRPVVEPVEVESAKIDSLLTKKHYCSDFQQKAYL